MEPRGDKHQPELVTVSTTTGKLEQHLLRARSGAAGAKILPAGAPATAGAKATARGAREAPPKQRFLRSGGLRLTQGKTHMHRKDNPTAAVPLIALQHSKPLETVVAPSKAVVAPRRATQPFRISDAVVLPVAATRGLTENHPAGRRRTTSHARSSTAHSSSNAHQTKYRSLQQTAPVIHGGKPHLYVGTRARDHAARFENTGAAASSGSRRGVNALLRRSLRATPTMNTTFLPCSEPQSWGNTLAELRQSLTINSFTSKASTIRGSSATLPLPSSASDSSLFCVSPCASSDGALSDAPSSAPFPAVSSGSLTEVSVASVPASFPSASSPFVSSFLEQPRSVQNSLATVKSPAQLKKDTSVRPLSTAQALRKSAHVRAAKEAARNPGSAAKAETIPESRMKAATSQKNSRDTKQHAGKAIRLLEALPTTPRLPELLEQSATSPAAGTSRATKPSPAAAAAARGARQRALGASQIAVKKVRGGSPSGVVSRATAVDVGSLATQAHPGAPLDVVFSARNALFSTTEMYSASAASSLSSFSSDKSSSTPSSAAPRSSPDDASPLSGSAATGSGSTLRSILRLPPTASLSMAVEKAERAKRPRRNARFALVGFAARDRTTPRQTTESQYTQPVQPATPPGVAAAIGEEEEEEEEDDEAAWASFEDASTEHASARLSVGERFPARWWGATRKRIKVTRAVLERWQMDTLTKWDEEQKQEIDVLSSSVEAVLIRVHELLTKEFQELIRPEWVIHSTDSLVQRMLDTREAAEERARRLGRKKADLDIPLWKGPSAFSIFGDRLVVLSQTPYSIIGVYARRTWAASLPVAVAEPIFQAAEEERRRLASPGKRLRTKAEGLRKRFLLGAKNVLSSQSPYGVAKGKSDRRATISRWPSCWSLPSSGRTRQVENTATLFASPGASTVVPGISARAGEATRAAQRAAVRRGDRGWALSPVNKLTRPVGGDTTVSGGPKCACKDVLAEEVAGCLGVQRARCAFPVEALKPHPPPGYGRAPVEAEDVRIFSELEDFLLINQVPIKRPPWDVRHTPLLSTLKRPSIVRSEETVTSTSKTGGKLSHESVAVEDAGEDINGEKFSSALDAVGSREATQLFPRCAGSLQDGTCGYLAMRSWNSWTCLRQESNECGHEQEAVSEKVQSKKPLLGQQPTSPQPGSPYAGAFAGSYNLLSARQEARPEPTSISDPRIEDDSGILSLHGRKGQMGETADLHGTGASDSLGKLVSPHIQRSTAPAPTAQYASRAGEYLTAKGYQPERRTVGIGLRAQSSVDAFEPSQRRSFPQEKQQQQQTPAPTTSGGERGTSSCWKAKTFCRRVKRDAGNKLLRQEDVKVSEFWKLHFKEDGTSVWSYEGLQCEPVGVSQMNSDSSHNFVVQLWQQAITRLLHLRHPCCMLEFTYT